VFIFFLYPFTLQEAPHTIHEQREAPNIRPVIRLFPVPDTSDGNNLLVIDKGNAHVPDNIGISFGRTIVIRWVLIIVMDDRFLGSEAISPD